jgi:hypothetical protein
MEEKEMIVTAKFYRQERGVFPQILSEEEMHKIEKHFDDEFQIVAHRAWANNEWENGMEIPPPHDCDVWRCNVRFMARLVILTPEEYVRYEPDEWEDRRRRETADRYRHLFKRHREEK